MGPQCSNRLLARDDSFLTQKTKMTKDYTLAPEGSINGSKLAYEAFRPFESLSDVCSGAVHLAILLNLSRGSQISLRIWCQLSALSKKSGHVWVFCTHLQGDPCGLNVQKISFHQ